MKNKSKTKIFIVTIGLIFAFLSISNYIFFNEQGEIIEIQDENNFKILKTSGGFSESFIHIDGSIPGNWSATTSYDWCSGNGSWGNPYVIENVIINASSSPTGSGIFIEDSINDYFIIRNCTIYNGGYGIMLEDTNNGILVKNNCSNNGNHGICLWDSCNNTISENIASNNTVHGIRLRHNCNNNNISGNTANDNGNYGILLREFCITNTISGNNVNKNSQYGIYLYVYCDNNFISGNTVSDNLDHGIILETTCVKNKILGNTVNNNKENGIYLENDCDHNIISWNTVNDNVFNGILQFGFCDNNTISGNTVNDNGGYGISFASQCNNNKISGNTANKNNMGIFFDGQCNNNKISENSLYNNQYGIYLRWFCFDNNISGNIIYKNDNYGIYLDCSNNLIFYNCILNNSIGNAYTVEINNWNNSLIGNYWGDYMGVDVNCDGIGDTPYDIPGSSSNKDHKPIINNELFFFRPPDDLSYEIGTEGHTIKWIITTVLMLPLNYNVFRYGVSIKTGRLYAIVNEIEINVDGLDTGLYGFSIEVYDGYVGTSTDGVWVTVTNTVPVFTAIPNDVSYEVGETGNNLSWTFSDVSTNNPSYTVTRNGVPIIIDNPCFSGEPIEITVDGLSVGSHGFTIEINDGYGGEIIDGTFVNVITSSDSELMNLLYVEIIDQSFSIEDFNITFSVCNESGHGIDFATTQTWWNGVDISESVVNLGNGLYLGSLNPITVAPGEDPILLNMTISASGYENKQFETYIAVDPETLEKGVEKDGDEFPFMILIIAIVSIAGGIGATLITVGILRKRKPTTEVM